MLHQVGVSFDLYYDARKHKIKMDTDISVRYAACIFRVEVLFISQTQFNTEDGGSMFIGNMDGRVRQYRLMEDKIP